MMNQEYLLKLLIQHHLVVVFKTIIDPFIGSLSFIKINSGVLKLGDEVFHAQSGNTIKISNLMTLVGKDQSN